MMQTAPQRQTQRAAAQHRQSYNDVVAQQAQKDRDAQAAAQQAAQDAAHQAEIRRMMSSGSLSGMGSDTPDFTTPTAPSIDTSNSNMHCVRQTSGNAGTMNCSN
jgi:hypothetical protein